MKKYLLKAIITFTMVFTIGIVNVHAEEAMQDEIFENTITHEEQTIEENEIINEKKIEEEPSDEYIETIGAYKESSKTNYLLITLSSGCILLITGLFVREKLKNN